jgi:hypothetical protein
MSFKNAVIIIDSGFSQDAVGQVKNLIGFYDLNSGIAISGAPLIAGDRAQFVLHNLCGDSLNHGTIILRRLLEMNPDCAFALVRAFDHGGRHIRTGWSDGKVASDGWVEGYLWARQLCENRGLTSVANLSFGGFNHAQDGSGWESFKLASAVGDSKSGHVLVAATGPGDGRAIHCSFTASENTVVHGFQRGTSTYNLWVDRNVAGNAEHRGWQLTVKVNGREVAQYEGQYIPNNIWNDRQQLTFVVEGEGNFEFSITPVSEFTPTRFDIFISQSQEAGFYDHVDDELVSEPACLSQVIAVGLQSASYGKCCVGGVNKPEVKLAGNGPISFRTPEVTALVASMLEADPTLDIAQVRQKLLAQFSQ